ncbi:nicotinamide N-methyltransferase-like [Discoglossus pictus]
MESPVAKNEAYKEDFSPKDYFNTYYAPGKGALAGECLDFMLKKLHETFSPGGVEGDTLIDIGAGPTIYHLLSACEVFNNIITSDYLPQNIAELQKWHKKDPSAIDWTSIVKRVCEMEGNSENWKKKEDKLRRTMKQVLKCDALKRNPFEPHILPTADCLLSCFCLEAACENMESYCNTLKNVKDLIKPGGHVVILSGLNATFYNVGEKNFYPLTTTKEGIEMAFKHAGYTIDKLEVVPRLDKSTMNVCDQDSYYFVHARKPHI